MKRSSTSCGVLAARTARIFGTSTESRPSFDPITPSVTHSSGRVTARSGPNTTGGTSAVFKVIALVTLPLYTRHLTRADYGTAELILTTIILLSIVLRLGLGEAFVRFHYLDADPARRRALARTATGTLLAVTTVAAVLIAVFAAPLSRLLIGLLLKTDTVTLVNLVSETRAVPEYLGRRCQPGLLSQALFDLLENPDARAAQRAAMALTMQRLGRGGEAPGLRAARSVMAAITSAPRPR